MKRQKCSTCLSALDLLYERRVQKVLPSLPDARAPQQATRFNRYKVCQTTAQLPVT